jgi:RNA polymerase sigma-70 factor, ECF subfamily
MGTMAAQMARSQYMPETLRADALEEMTTLISERLSYFQGVARRRLDNMADAEDAVQDAFLSAWKHLDKFKGQARMSTWMTVVVMNSARMAARKRRRTVHLSLEAPIQDDEILRLSDMVRDTRPDPEDQAGRRELEHRLRRLSDHLSPGLLDVIRLCGLEGLSVREAADTLGLTVSAVKSRAARARRELRRLDRVKPARVASPGRFRPIPQPLPGAPPRTC